jgi:polyphenol oxidase
VIITPDWPAPPNVKSAITTRQGGASQGVYTSFNLGTHVKDEPEKVATNRELLVNQLGLKKTPQWLEQVHGNKVVEASDDGRVRTADACVTTEKGVACTVMTADCLPVLLCDKQGTQVAAVHCGWRSLAQSILQETLETFPNKSQVMAYLGPAISCQHFEVGIDVLEAFFQSSLSTTHTDQIAKSFTPAKRPLHFYADIYALARAELSALGVMEIYGGDYCTYADVDRFYSYRRDGVTGRMASLIWLL